MSLAPPRCEIPEGQTAIGFVNDQPDPAVPLDTITIPEDYRLHGMVLGSTGSGKSTILKLLILHNLLRGDGLVVLDPLHDLAAWTAQRVPKWRIGQLVYISPAQLARTGRATPINPLEWTRGSPAQAGTEFAETLLKAFGTTGVQMQQLLQEAATSLIAANRGGLGLLRKFLIDQSVQNEVLADVHIKSNLDFWESVAPKLSKEAVTHVDNKITPITSNPAVGPFFEGRTGFDLKGLIDGGGILIFDGAGCTSDVERTLFTTFLLNMITAAATELAQDRPQGVKPRTLYLYIDEIQMLESEKLKEMLHQVRKMGIRMTLATQQLDTMNKDNVSAMVGNCDLYMASRCTLETARLIAPKMGVKPESLTQVPKFHMNFHMSLPEGDIHGKLLRTRNMDLAAKYWDTLESVVDRSLENYGQDVDLAKYTNAPAADYDVTPLMMAVMSSLYHNHDGLDIEGVFTAVERFNPSKRRIAQLLTHLTRTGMASVVSGGDGTSTYRLRTGCMDKYFDVAALKGRAGGDPHIRTIKSLQESYSRRGYFTRMDVGDTNDPKPDLEVCEPAVGPNGDPDPERWGNRVAVEVETGPSRHPNKPGKPGQVYKNWKKSQNKSMTVWYVVYNESGKLAVDRQLAELGIRENQYECTVISADEVDSGVAVPVPPGFDPIGPLPGCEGARPLDLLILSKVPPEGVRATALRALIPKKYGNPEVAEAVDRLKEEGRLEGRLEGRSEVLRAV